MPTFLSAYDIDVNTRVAGNRLWTIINTLEGAPEIGETVIVACLEDEDTNCGFGLVVRVHEIAPRDSGRHLISFDWLDEHTCH